MISTAFWVLPVQYRFDLHACRDTCQNIFFGPQFGHNLAKVISAHRLTVTMATDKKRKKHPVIPGKLARRAPTQRQGPPPPPPHPKEQTPVQPSAPTTLDGQQHGTPLVSAERESRPSHEQVQSPFCATVLLLKLTHTTPFLALMTELRTELLGVTRIIRY